MPLDPSVMLKQRDPEEMHEDAAAVVATVVVAAAVVVSPAQLYPTPDTKTLQLEAPEQQVPLDPSVKLRQSSPAPRQAEATVVVVATVVDALPAQL